MAKKLRVLAIVLFAFLLIGLIFQKPFSTHLKVILFISEQFPQIPFKPLTYFTKPPTHQRLELDSQDGKIIADLFLPNDSKKHSALIIAMGVRTQKKDKPLMVSLSNTLARLGYIVLWPKLEPLENEEPKVEEAETFIKSFEYLKELESVDKNRISYLGISVGSSIAYIAITDPKINYQVKSLIWFGGYYNIYDYLDSLKNKSFKENGELISWEPSQGGVDLVKAILSNRNSDFDSIYQNDPDFLKKINPQDYPIPKAKLFILHEKSDSYVPYIESVKLHKALGEKDSFLLINLFEHVQPKQGLSPEVLGELIKLYQFVYLVFNYV